MKAPKARQQSKKTPQAHAPVKKRKRDDLELERLASKTAQLDQNVQCKEFRDLPLSEYTLSGLASNHFTTMTDIQRRAIPLALKGYDILGAAKTGSGKTLAFLVPVLENLYRSQCIGPDAGLGAMIIAPTRELAIQTFDILRRIGRKGHMFAAGLIIGGKNIHEEQNALARMNIVVCTPGRMLQHLSQTVTFSVDNLKMLILDEADRILDMGFQRDLDAIVEYLPEHRQTLLFSATQTRKVSDLARLSLKDPEYVSVHEKASTATPSSLQQNYVVSPLPEKLDTLWGFLKSIKSAKILVFFSSGKQVRFAYESFRRMQPGIPLLHLHGRQKQNARIEITNNFSSAKASCLFATDVAARGLDFPAVDWVVQVDCPEDAETYIHRVGRTARYERDGRAILFLDPSEEKAMLRRLEAKRVPIEKVNVRKKKEQSIKNQLQNMCFKNAQLKYLGQKAFQSYVRSIYVQKDKEMFQLDQLALEDFASSLGLPGAPRIKFLKGDDMKALKNAPRQMILSEDSDSENEGDHSHASKARKSDGNRKTKVDRMFQRQNQDVLADHYRNLLDSDDSAAPRPDSHQNEGAGVDDLLSVKRRISVEPSGSEAENVDDHPKLVKVDGIKEPLLIDSKRAEKRLQSRKKMLKYRGQGKRLVFDDEGNARPIYELQNEQDFLQRGIPDEQRKDFVSLEQQMVEEADLEDRQVAKAKRKEKKHRLKERERMENGDPVRRRNDFEIVEASNHLLDNFMEDAKAADSGEESAPPRHPELGRQAHTGSPVANKSRARWSTEARSLENLEQIASGLLDN